jgi:hypothetical protein
LQFGQPVCVTFGRRCRARRLVTHGFGHAHPHPKQPARRPSSAGRSSSA